jgi:hypothetical protein
VGINHLADLARLPFRGSVNDYQDAFLAKMAHAGHLSQEQQVSVFTGGLPTPFKSMLSYKPLGIYNAPWRSHGRMNSVPQPWPLSPLPEVRHDRHCVSITSSAHPRATAQFSILLVTS